MFSANIRKATARSPPAATAATTHSNMPTLDAPLDALNV
jgi:hypothetical protein